MLEKHFKMLDYKDFFLLDYSLTKQEWEIVIHLAHKDKWKMYQYHKKKTHRRSGCTGTYTWNTSSR